MSAEKERRYQEFYKNRFVNPIDQGIGRRTGWVLNKEVRKDSEGFELFEDYWSESGEESLDDFSLHANKENKNGKPYKLSSPIPLMPDFTPSSRGSTNADPLTDAEPKTNSAAAKTNEAVSTNTAKSAQKPEQQKAAEDGPQPAATVRATLETDKDLAVTVGTPQHDGGMRDSDITGSIIKGGNSFQFPNSALQEFKTKTRLSFSGGDPDIQKRKSTRGKSSSDDSGSATDSTLKASQSEGEPESHISTQDSSPNKPPTSTGQTDQNSLAVKNRNRGTEKTSSNGASTAQEYASKKEEKGRPTAADAETVQQKSAMKSTIRKSNASLKHPASNRKVLGDTVKSRGRKRRNVPYVEEDIQMSEGKEVFISLQKSVVSQQDAPKEMASDAMNGTLIDQSSQDGDDEDVDIVDDEHHGYSYSLTSKSKKTSKKASEKLTTNKGTRYKSKTGIQQARGKKCSTQETSKDEVVVISSNEDEMLPTQEVTQDTSKQPSKNDMGASSEESGPSNKKSRRQPSRIPLLRKSERMSTPSQKNAEISKQPAKNAKGTSSEDSGPSNEKALRQHSQTSRKSERMMAPSREKTGEISKRRAKNAKGTSSEDSGPSNEKALQRPSRTSRKSERTGRNKSQRGAKSSSSDRESGTATSSDAETKKGCERPRRKMTKKKAEQNSKVVSSEDAGSTGTDEDQQQRKSSRRKRTAQAMEAGTGKEDGGKSGSDISQERESSEDTKASRVRNKSGRGTKKANSFVKDPDLEAHPTETADAEENDVQAPNDSHQEEVPSKKPAIPPPSQAKNKRVSVHFSTVEVISSEIDDYIDSGETQTPRQVESLHPQEVPLSNDDGDDESGSPKKKFKRTPGVQLNRRRSTSRKSVGKTEESKSTQEGEEDSNRTQRRSSVVTGAGRKKRGKRKLYSSDLPDSFLKDPSPADTSAVAGSTGKKPADQENIGKPSSGDQPREQPATAAKSNPSERGRGRRGNTRGRVTSKRTSILSEVLQENKAPEPDNVVLDFLTKYESSRESESPESEGDDPSTSAATETSETGGTSSSKDTPAALFTTVYPDPTPRSILKDSTTASAGARKKNLTLQFFEVPRRKAIIMPPDEEENGRRRTRRNRVRPVEFWRNERPEYQRRKSGGFVLVGIHSPGVSSPEATIQQRSKRTRGKKTLPQTPANVSMHVSPPPGSKLAEHPSMVVINPDTQTEVEVDTLRTAKMNTFVGPSGKEATPDDPITLCKSITQKAFSSGILTIRPLCEKGMQFVQKDTMVFFISRGKVSVTIHHTTSILQNGDMFFVPQGNMYNIKNLRRDEAKLVFFQHKGR